MSFFDVGAGANSIIKSATTVGSNTTGNLGSALGTVGKLAGALSNLNNPAALLSSLRSINLPTGGNVSNPGGNIGAQWGGSDVDKDWRVRLSLPNVGVFTNSWVLQPLINAGGMVFPYTPGVSISHSANYEDTAVTHQNYQFITYQNSRVDKITITAPFFVEDAVQAQYWLAAVHYFRSVTKMFTGSDQGSEQGNPPPIVYLNGYGDFVFKNIPVVVTSFGVDLSSDANYISTTMSQTVGRPAGEPASARVNSTAPWLSSAAAAVGFGGLQNAAEFISGAGNLLNSGSGGAGGLGIGGASHVPVKSTFSVTLQPIYSRQAVKQFSLNDFVQGKYVGNQVGYN